MSLQQASQPNRLPACRFLCFSGGCGRVRILHHRINPNLLPQDSPEPSTAGDPERNGVAVSGQLQRRTSAAGVQRRYDVSRRPPHVDDRSVPAHVDARQAQDGAA